MEVAPLVASRSPSSGTDILGKNLRDQASPADELIASGMRKLHVSRGAAWTNRQ